MESKERDEVLGGMAGQTVVIIKWGGGLITEKRKLSTPNARVLDGLARTLALVLYGQDGERPEKPEPKVAKLKVLLVHGAGSFGHLKAKENKLHQGWVEGMQVLYLFSFLRWFC